MPQQEETRVVAQEQTRASVAQQKLGGDHGHMMRERAQAHAAKFAGAHACERHQEISVTLSVPAEDCWMAATFCPGVTVKYSAASAGRYVSVATAVGVPSLIRMRQSVVAASRTL